MRIVSLVGARPNFVKLAPVWRALRARRGIEHAIVHTGQHYDELMSDAFFADFGIPQPQHNLHVGSGSHARQTAAVLERFEALCVDLGPDWVLVYGDVNSTIGGALAAVKLGIRVAHVEAGLRSRDRSMPEEHNRVVTDHLADVLCVPSRDALANLRREGIPDERIAFVGNVMIDTLVEALPRARDLDTLDRVGVAPGAFALVTLHRPSNVDDPRVFGELCAALAEIHTSIPVVFPVHPRAQTRLAEWGLTGQLGSVRLLEPLPYLAMLQLTDAAALVITDSGGIQEETTFLGVPCLTVRPNTERPVTLTEGTNRLVSPAREALVTAASCVVRRAVPPVLERWDGRAGERIAEVLCDGARYH